MTVNKKKNIINIWYFVGLVILIIGILLKAELVKRIAYGIFIVGAATTLMAMNSGEGAEEIVEELGRNHHAIHEHEEHAETFAILAYILGLFSAIAFWLNWKKHPFNDLSMYLVALFSVAVLFLARGTGQSGGEISHDEIKSSVPVEKE